MNSLVEFSHPAVADEFRDPVLPDLFRDDAVDFGVFLHDAGVIDLEFMGTDTFHAASVRDVFQFSDAFAFRTDNFHMAPGAPL